MCIRAWWRSTRIFLGAPRASFLAYIPSCLDRSSLSLSILGSGLPQGALRSTSAHVRCGLRVGLRHSCKFRPYGANLRSGRRFAPTVVSDCLGCQRQAHRPRPAGVLAGFLRWSVVRERGKIACCQAISRCSAGIGDIGQMDVGDALGAGRRIAGVAGVRIPWDITLGAHGVHDPELARA